jgi:hypothetical protein
MHFQENKYGLVHVRRAKVAFLGDLFRGFEARLIKRSICPALLNGNR